MADGINVNTGDEWAATLSVAGVEASASVSEDSPARLTADDGDTARLTVQGVEAEAEVGDGNVPLDGSVTTAKLDDGAVTTDKLAQGAVTNDKIANYTIGDSKLDPSGVIARVAQMQEALEGLDLTIDPDDLGLEQDEDTKYVYPTYRGVRSSNGIPLAASGGGGGGGTVGGATLTVTNVTGWLSKTISAGGSVTVSVTWSSIEDGMETGDGSLTVSVGGSTVLSQTVSQGRLDVDVSRFIKSGSNKVKVRVADVYDNARTITFTVSVVELTIASGFDTSGTFAAGAAIDYTYVPTGAAEKRVRFEVDGQQVATATVTASGRQQTQTLPAMAHGAHTLRVWFTAEVGGEEVSSNVIYHELVVVNPSSAVPIVAMGLHRDTATQYETLQVPFRAYVPGSMTATVTLYANGNPVSTVTVDRTWQTWAYRIVGTGYLELSVRIGTVAASATLSVESSGYEVEAETAGLALHLATHGRSNGEEHPEQWADTEHGINCTLTGFTFSSADGWQLDADGATVLRVAGDARVQVPYMPFSGDWRSTGKTIEVEFATRDVVDPDAVVLSCMSGGRGITVTPQLVTLASEQTTTSTRYKDGEHVRVSLVCGKRGDGRLLYTYVNGVMSGCVQYPADDDFAQVSPVGITIGGAGCTIDVYHVRVYDNDLTRHQVLDNWIADSSTSALMVERARHNAVTDEYGQVSIDMLPADLPHMVIECAELPQYKGDKKTVSGYYVDPTDQSKSFSFDGCQANVQGTSSAPYARKNYDLQFKSGFEMVAGGHADDYQLDATIKPNNRFVLKADVASSEGANNVELVKLFCDADPYRRPEELADPLVRKGIWGRPIVLFWRDTETNTLQFMGRYNFNLPKRAPVPYGYTGLMESWEFQNNTSNLMLFLTDYFDETMVEDPETGDVKAAWRYDYEARFPEDTWGNFAKLQELQSFVYSTYRANATNAALPSTYTDVDGNEHTRDTAEYRLAKFRTEFGRYAEVDSFLFYYIFTELFLMVDSRAKNLFIGFSGGTASGLAAIDRKAVAEPYDMDTAIGISNEGTLVFGYNLEDTDHLVGGADVFNGQNSVLWNNVRDAFPTEIAQMYQRLRSEGTLSYATVRQRFEEHQSRWPEAIFNEDSQFKYIDPLIAPDPGKEPTAVYLPMLQGSKAEQRKWWLYNRFRYMDSKWNAGDALTDVIQLRGYAKADITVTPWADVYPTVKYGSYVVRQRGSRGVPATLVCPLDNVNDTEIYVYSASQLSSVGDLSGLKVGFADFSRGTRLTSVKVGSGASGYTNPNLTSLLVGSSPLLQDVDARNCTALAGAVDLGGATGLVHARFGGTAVTSVSLPTGGTLRTLQLPSTVTNLTVIGQPNITALDVAGYANLTTLRIENCGDAVPYMTILGAMPAGGRVRVMGLEMAVTSTDDVEALYDLLDGFRGMDESGNNTERAQVSGRITGLGTVTGAWMAQMLARYPSIEITYQHMTCEVTYKTWDGTTTLHTETVEGGGNCTWNGSPERESTAQYTFQFAGWSSDMDAGQSDGSTVGVRSDITVYAAYLKTVRTYTVTWKNQGNVTLETDRNVPYGTTPHYDGATPTYQGQTSRGWTPIPSAVTGDITYTASYVPTYQITWKDVDGSTLATTTVQQGTVPTYPGATPTGSPNPFRGWTPTPVAATANATYTALYQSASKVVQYLDGTMTECVTGVSTIRNYTLRYATKLTTVDLTTTDAVTIGDNAFYNLLDLQHLVIRSATKANIGTAALNRTKINSGYGAVYVPAALVDVYRADSKWGKWGKFTILPLDRYPATTFDTITDSWAQIAAASANGTYASKYKVGDTKSLVYDGNEVLMELVAMDADRLSDNSGYAPMTWVGKYACTWYEPMNATDTNAGGWAVCDMRSYLSDTVLPNLPSDVRGSIKAVTKYSDGYADGEVVHDVETTDLLWLPSKREVFGGTYHETQGPAYDYFISDTSHRDRMFLNPGDFYDVRMVPWWMRTSSQSNTGFTYVNSGSGTVYDAPASTKKVTYGYMSVLLCFCI